MNLSLPPSPRTCGGLHRWPVGHHQLRLCASLSGEFCRGRQGRRSKPAALDEMAEHPSAAADFCNKICQQETCGRDRDSVTRHQSLYAKPTRKSLIGARVPASAEFVGAFTNPKASRLVYRYSILPRIVSVIA